MALSGNKSTSFSFCSLGFSWNATQNAASNTSTVTVKCTFTRNYQINSTATKYGTLTIDGQSYSFSAIIGGTGTITLFTKTVTVSHDTSGNKNLSISLSFNPAVTLSGTYYGTQYCNGSWGLTQIPRKANITTWKCSTANFRSLTMSWAADVTVDSISYQINGGTWIYPSGSGTSGTFNISSLSPGTSYSITFSVRRKDSQVWSTYKTITASTLAGATLSISATSWTINNTLSITVSNPNNAYVKLYTHVFAVNSSGTTVETTDPVIRNLGKVATGTYSLTLTTAEKDAIYPLMIYSNTGSISFPYGSYDSETDNINYSSLFGAKVIGKITLVLDSSNINPILSSVAATLDSTSTGVTGNSSYGIQNISKINISVSKSNCSALKSAFLKSLVITYNNVSETYDLTDSRTSFAISNLVPTVTGSYVIKAYVTDSRNNKSSTITKTFTILNYHSPVIVPTVKRELSSGGVISLSFTAQYSRLIVNSTDKNLVKALTYKYAVKGSSYNSSTSITGYTSSNSSNNVDKNLSYSNTSFLTLDETKNYTFFFTFQDALRTYTTTVDVVDGVPIMRILDSGQISINMKPDTTTLDTKLFVGGNAKIIGKIYERNTALEDKYRRYNVLAADASGGTTGYIHIARIMVKNTYANQPIEIKLSQRNHKTTSTLFIRFTNSNSTDPTLASFQVDGTATAYIYKSATSTWDVYVLKGEANDCIDVVDYTIPSYMSNKVNLTWKNTLSSTAPAGSTKATYIDVVANSITVSGNESVGGNLSVTGKVNASSGISVTGDLVVNNTNVEDSINKLKNEAKVRVITGSAVKTANGNNYVQLHTANEIKAFFTSKYGSAPSDLYNMGVSVVNGDGNAIGSLGMYAEWWGTTLWVYFNKAFTGQVRVNFCYTAYY